MWRSGEYVLLGVILLKNEYLSYAELIHSGFMCIGFDGKPINISGFNNKIKGGYERC